MSIQSHFHHLVSEFGLPQLTEDTSYLGDVCHRLLPERYFVWNHREPAVVDSLSMEVDEILLVGSD